MHTEEEGGKQELVENAVDVDQKGKYRRRKVGLEGI